MMRNLTITTLLILLGAATGCLPEPRPYLVARHEAEKVRWYVERDEDTWPSEQARSAHLEISRRFGPSSDGPPESPRAREHYRVRQVIAGSSALFAADLEAHQAGASMELAAEYASIAERWGDQTQLRFLATLREAATRQRIGHGSDALTVFRNLSKLARTFDLDGLPGADDLLVDLEVHVALLALQLRPDREVAGDLGRARERLRAEAERRGNRAAARHPLRREAEIAFLAGDLGGAQETLESLAADAPTPDERAELELILGEIHQYARNDLEAAESSYRRAAEQGSLIGASAQARVRLAELALIRGKPKIGLRTADEVLTLGARAREGRNSEALYWRARCLLEMGHWTEAIPSLEEGANGDPTSPFTLACAARLHGLRSTSASSIPSQATALLLRVAASVPPDPPVEVPTDWALARRAERARFAWDEGVAELRELARRSRDPEQARAARAAAGKILRERTIFAQRTPDDTPTGRR